MGGDDFGVSDACLVPCVLIRISGGARLRSADVAGLATPADRIEVGRSFFIRAEAFDEAAREQGMHRFVTTSPVVEVERVDEATIVFKTATGSVYRASYRAQS